MEPVTIIATALALGAAAGLKPTAEQAVKDAYSALKAAISRKFAGPSIIDLERAPDSKANHAALERALTQGGADKSEEVLREAKELLDAIETHAPEAAVTIGVDLEEIKAGWLEIEGVTSTGTGVRITDAQVEGGLTIKGVDAGVQGGDSPKR